MKTLRYFTIIITGLVVIGVIFFVLFQNYSDQQKSNLNHTGYTGLTNYFSDNVTRIAMMDVNTKQYARDPSLSVNMSIKLDVIGKTDAIHIYPIIAPWGNVTTNNVILEDENHMPIQIPSDCRYDCGIFQQLLVTPGCSTKSGEVFDRIKMTNVVLPIHNPDYTRIFAKYSLSDILPEDGQYHIKFIAPYYVTINLPENSIVLSNHTTTCASTLDPNQRSVFAADVVFKLD